MSSLGQMANAPLAYVFAMVRTSPPPSLDRRIPGLQEMLAATYPELRKSTTQQISFLPRASAIEMMTWDFIDEAQSAAVMVREDLLALHATSYANFDSFFARLQEVLSAYETVVADSRPICHQFGLRYVDVIVPEKDRTPNDYVKGGLHGATFPFHDGRETAVFVAQVPRGDGLFTFRYTRQFVKSDGVPFPGDLRHEILKPSGVAQRAARTNGHIGVLDFDRFIVERMTFNAEKIAGYFGKLHDEQSAAFRAVTSDYAAKYWNTKQSETAHES